MREAIVFASPPLFGGIRKRILKNPVLRRADDKIHHEGHAQQEAGNEDERLRGQLLHDELQEDRRAHSDADHSPRVPAPGKIHRRVVIHAAADVAGQQQGGGGACQKQNRPVRKQQRGGGRKAERPREKQRRFSRALGPADVADQGKGEKSQARTDKAEGVQEIDGAASQKKRAALVDNRLGQHEREEAQREADSAKKPGWKMRFRLLFCHCPPSFAGFTAARSRGESGSLSPVILHILAALDAPFFI